jgi:hypothetical protein
MMPDVGRRDCSKLDKVLWGRLTAVARELHAVRQTRGLQSASMPVHVQVSSACVGAFVAFSTFRCLA